MPNHVSEISKQGIDVRVVPAAAGHFRRESTDKAESTEWGRGLVEHCCCHAMITVEDGKWPSGIYADQQNGWVNISFTHRHAQASQFVKERIVRLYLQSSANLFDCLR